MAYVDAALELRRAEQAARSVRTQEALSALWRIFSADAVEMDAHQTAVTYVARLLEADSNVQTQRIATLAFSYTRAFESAAQRCGDNVLDLARVRTAAGQHEAASEAYEKHGWYGHAALSAEQAQDFKRAARNWDAFLALGAVRESTYEAGLARFNHSRVLKKLGNAGAARKEAIRAVQLLEMAADVYESHGERERAFDCFSILLQVGEDGAFENLAEGYLNSIRVLTADNLQNYVAQYYDDFYRKAWERGEFAAASSVARDAAKFCKSRALPYASHYRREAAKAHVAHATQLWRTTNNAPLVENAYAAAIDDLLALGLFSEIAEIYVKLSDLPLPEARKARYRQLASRVARETDRRPHFHSLAEHLRSKMAYPDIWRTDIAEYEEDGDPVESMVGVLLDPSWPSFTRTRALACAFYAMGPSIWPVRDNPEVHIASLLGRTEIYAALAPLERMSEHADPNVRAAVMRASSNLYFKRTFRILKKGVRDPDPGVKKEAIQTVSQLYFPHALDPLQQIFEETDDSAVRRAALASIGQIATPDALKTLSDIARHGTRVERQQAQSYLRQRR